MPFGICVGFAAMVVVCDMEADGVERDEVKE
jgi:hypothetical protein